MNTELLKREFQYRTARSSGSGGQNVNKVETKVEIVWDINASQAMSDEEKTLILDKLANHINKDGFLQVVNQTERTQLGNKSLAEKKILKLIEKSLIVIAPRLMPKTPPSVIEARRRNKRVVSIKKATRRKVRLHGDDDSDLS